MQQIKPMCASSGHKHLANYFCTIFTVFTPVSEGLQFSYWELNYFDRGRMRINTQKKMIKITTQAHHTSTIKHWGNFYQIITTTLLQCRTSRLPANFLEHKPWDSCPKKEGKKKPNSMYRFWLPQTNTFAGNHSNQWQRQRQHSISRKQ